MVAGCTRAGRPSMRSMRIRVVARAVRTLTENHEEFAMQRTAIHDEIKAAFGLVPEWIQQMPEASLAGFWGLFRDFYLAETTIPNKYKELIGIGVSAATRCRYCVLFHTEGARLHGATDEEIAEASMMAGVTMCGSSFLNGQAIDFQGFARETEQIVDHVRKQGNGGKARGGARGHGTRPRA
jgi:AhpD family alkylhydroperoxidase